MIEFKSIKEIISAGKAYERKQKTVDDINRMIKFAEDPLGSGAMTVCIEFTSSSPARRVEQLTVFDLDPNNIKRLLLEEKTRLEEDFAKVADDKIKAGPPV